MEYDPTRKPHWTDFAACRGMSATESLRYFYPEDAPGRGFKVVASRLTSAVRLAEETFCGRCPVRVVCLERELERGQEQYGVFAATSPEMRRALARTRSRMKCPKCAQQNPRSVIEAVDGRLEVHQVCFACGMSWTAEPSLAEAS